MRLKADRELASLRSLGFWNDHILAGLMDGNVAMWHRTAPFTCKWKTLVSAGREPIHFVGPLNAHRWLSASRDCIGLWKGAELVVLFKNPAADNIDSAVSTSDGQVIVHARKQTWLLNPFVYSVSYLTACDTISSLSDGRIVMCTMLHSNMEVNEYF